MTFSLLETTKTHTHEDYSYKRWAILWPPTMDKGVKNERTKTYLFDLQKGFTEVWRNHFLHCTLLWPVIFALQTAALFFLLPLMPKFLFHIFPPPSTQPSQEKSVLALTVTRLKRHWCPLWRCQAFPLLPAASPSLASLALGWVSIKSCTTLSVYSWNHDHNFDFLLKNANNFKPQMAFPSFVYFSYFS